MSTNKNIITRTSPNQVTIYDRVCSDMSTTTTNPDFVIQDFVDNDRELHLFQEKDVPGGTKTRLISVLMQRDTQHNEFVYAGPPTGYAQIALGYCGKLYHKKATIFLSFCNKHTQTQQMTQAKKYGANLKLGYKSLQLAQEAAENYVNASPTKRFLCPFGLGDPEFINILADQFLAANPPQVNPGATIWVAIGSGTILRALLKIYPDVHFGCVIVGKKIWEDQFSPHDWSRMTLYYAVNEIPFWENTKIIPPYDSLVNYDAKIWMYASKYAKSGDYIFNVAGDGSPRPQV
jgi:hypothetical protein